MYANALKNSKVVAVKYSCVEKISQLCTTQFFVTKMMPVPFIVKLISTLQYPGEVNSFKLSLDHARITCPLG